MPDQQWLARRWPSHRHCPQCSTTAEIHSPQPGQQWAEPISTAKEPLLIPTYIQTAKEIQTTGYTPIPSSAMTSSLLRRLQRQWLVMPPSYCQHRRSSLTTAEIP